MAKIEPAGRAVRPLAPWLVLLAAAGAFALTMGVRQTMGLFLSALNTSTGLGVGRISLAFALGQLWWGLTQPFAGAVAPPARTAVAMGAAAHRTACRAAVGLSTSAAPAGERWAVPLVAGEGSGRRTRMERVCMPPGRRGRRSGTALAPAARRTCGEARCSTSPQGLRTTTSRVAGPALAEVTERPASPGREA